MIPGGRITAFLLRIGSCNLSFGSTAVATVQLLSSIRSNSCSIVLILRYGVVPTSKCVGHV